MRSDETSPIEPNRLPCQDSVDAFISIRVELREGGRVYNRRFVWHRFLVGTQIGTSC